ncbi:MAG TPA: hypothetical protein V6D19_23075 [Stenomitos sp.]
MSNGNGNIQPLQEGEPELQVAEVATEVGGDRHLEFVDFKEAIGHLARQLNADHLSNKEQFRRIEEKLDLWIRTNQALMEGQQETAKSNHRLVEAILENTSEMQRTTQEQQRCANSFEQGTRLLSELENRLKALEQQTIGFAKATTDLNSILNGWKPLFAKMQTVMEVVMLQLPSQKTQAEGKRSKSKKQKASQELNDSLKESPTPDDESQNQPQSSQSHQTLNPQQVKRWIAITRRDLLLTSRFSLGWGVFSTIMLILILSYGMTTGSTRINGVINKLDTIHKTLQGK